MKKESVKVLFFALLNVALLFVAHLFNNQILILLSLIFMTMFVLTAKSKYFLPLMLFYLPWSPVLKISPGSISFFTIVAVLVFFKLVFIEKFSISKKTIAIVILLVILTAFAKVIFLHSFSLDYFVFFMMLLLFSIYCKKYHKSLSFPVSSYFFTFGIISACFAALNLMNLPHMQEYINVYTWENKGLVRLSGFYGDSNFYSAQLLVAITCNLFLLIFEKGKLKVFIVALLLLLVYCGSLSVSKSFILILAVVFLLWLINVFLLKRQGKLKIFVLLCIIFIGVLIVGFGLFSSEIKMYMVRFGMVNNVSSLTTGRSDIFENYLRFFYDNPLMLLFGQGYTNISYDAVNNRASHNTIIQSVYQFGIAGTIVLVLWILNLSESFKEKIKNKSFVYVSMLITAFIGFFTSWLALDMLYFDDFFYFIVMFFFIRSYIIKRLNEEL